MRANSEEILLRVRETAQGEATARSRQEAFARLVGYYQNYVFGIALAYLGDFALAEDAAQETFVSVWQHLPQLRDTQAFPAYLRRLTLTACNRLHRKRKTNPLPLTTLTENTVDETDALLEQIQRRQMIADALQTLPATERRVIVLLYWNQHSYEEIAAFLEISTVAVKKRLTRARSLLQERLTHLMETDLPEYAPSRTTTFLDRTMAFTKLFSAAVDSGKPLIQSIQDLAVIEENVDFRTVLEKLAMGIRNGELPSRIMARHPHYFTPHYIAAIHEGEQSGNLEVSLQYLAGIA